MPFFFLVLDRSVFSVFILECGAPFELRLHRLLDVSARPAYQDTRTPPPLTFPPYFQFSFYSSLKNFEEKKYQNRSEIADTIQ